MSKTRILHVVFSLAPGGMENGIVNVSNLLNLDEFDLHVCCLEDSGAFSDRFPQPENIYTLNKAPGFSWSTVSKLAQTISRIKPHVVHSHNFGPLVYSSIASFFGTRVPILHGEHGQFTPEECTPRRLRHRRWLYRSCREVHTVSHGLRDRIVELKLGSTPITALVNGVDLNRYKIQDRPDLREELGIPLDSPVIGMVARLRPTKRHTLLIKAFSCLAAQDPAPHLLLVGDGPMREQVMKAIDESGCSDRIHLVGFKKDPAPFYHVIDLLVIPSTQEGLSNAVLEALACGVPVLCHTACGNDEAITHGKDGWIVPLDSTEQIHHQLTAALSQRDKLPEMGQAGRDKVASRFPLAQMIRSYEEVYRRVAKK